MQRTELSDTYARLAAPFDVLQHDVRGGVEVTFITGEQCASRLNEVLGVGGWSFRILHQEIHQEADEVWVLGELEAMIDGERVVKQQFGSQKVKRSRSSGAPLDLGFDLKGAGTDCLKKCASLIGVALYLYDKSTRPAQRNGQQARQQPPQQRREPTPISRPALPAERKYEIHCKWSTTEGEVCDKVLEPVPAKNWSAPDLANESTKIAKRALCWEHYQSVTQRAV